MHVRLTGTHFNMTGIYYIKNKLDDKIYIGSSVNIEHRLNKHKSDLIASRHDNRHMQFAWNKYGADAFAFDVVMVTPKSLLLQMEQLFIDACFGDNCYNICKVAGKPPACVKHSSETKLKIAKAIKGITRSEETRLKISKSRKGIKLGPQSKEHKQKLSMALKKHQRTAEHCKNISIAKKGVK